MAPNIQVNDSNCPKIFFCKPNSKAEVWHPTLGTIITVGGLAHQSQANDFKWSQNTNYQWERFGNPNLGE